VIGVFEQILTIPFVAVSFLFAVSLIYALLEKSKIGLISTLIMAAILSIVVSLSTWNSDKFQQAVFPKKYWTKQVEKLERKIEAGEISLKSHEISLAEKRELAPIENYYRPYKWRTLLGDTDLVKELCEKESELAIREIKDLEERIEIGRRILKEDREHLGRARQELFNLRGKVKSND